MNSKSLKQIIRNRKKTTISLVSSVLATAILIPATLLAWGPERATFTIESPAPYVTFDSITNNPNYGDERNFVTIKDTANTAAGGWVDDINVENGKEYWVRMYVHNNAAANLNLVAHNVAARFNLPDYSSDSIQIDGYLSASNANPTQIWDQAVFHGSSDFSLDYIEGSATYTNNAFTGGTSLADTVISSGATLGYSQMNGDIPGCYQYDGVVIFKVKAITEDFDIEKSVRINGLTDKTFFETVSVSPDGKVDFQIYFENTGGIQLFDIIVIDTLPAGLSYIPGSTYLYNSSGLRQVADGVTTTGLNIGGYLPEGNAYLKFSAQMASNDQLPTCGLNTLTNTARITTAIGAKEDTASVTVTKTCDENPPVQECKPGIPVGDARCTDTPVTPPELPTTGTTEIVSTLVSLALVGASVAYYIESRRRLRRKILDTVSMIEVGTHPHIR